MKSFFLKARTGDSFNQWTNIKIQAPDSIYFMGICGTAMASLAVYLKQEGFKVLGSDQNIYPPMSDTLSQAGIPVSAYKENNIKPLIKLIVVGNVISKTHKEIRAVQNLGIPCLSLPEFLEQTLINKTKNIIVAGTHGKSTSTALMSYVADLTGQNPSFFIGAIAKNFLLLFVQRDQLGSLLKGMSMTLVFLQKDQNFFITNPLLFF